jgi:chemotaxis protein CheC
MELDALTEVFNVGLSRAASQLSELLQDRIDIDMPNIKVVGHDEVAEALMINDTEVVAGIAQEMDGYIRGSAMLIFPTDEAHALVKALIGSVPTLETEDLRKFEHEAMSEIGNIIISSAIATMSDLLDGEVQLTIPSYTEDTVNRIIASNSSGLAPEDVRVIVMRAALKAFHRQVSGNLVMLLSLDFIGKLLHSLGLEEK